MPHTHTHTLLKDSSSNKTHLASVWLECGARAGAEKAWRGGGQRLSK